MRHDFGALQPELGAPVRRGAETVYPARIARAHGPDNPLVYPWGKEYRDHGELSSIAKQVVGKRVVANHGPDFIGREIGRVVAARVDGDFVIADLAIRDAEVIERGWRELSLGYDSSPDARGYQRGIVVDHVAVVERGRCGDSCVLRADACACGGACYPSKATRKEAHHMDPEKQAEALRSVSAQLAEVEAKTKALETERDAQKLRADTAEGRLQDSQKQISDLQTQVAAQAAAVETEAIKREKTRADAAEEKIRNFDAAFEARVAERVALETTAGVIMGPDFKCKGLDDRQIMATVVKRLDADADVSQGVEIGILRGRFLAATDRHAAGARALGRVAAITASAAAEGKRIDRRDAKRNAWKKPLPNSREARQAAAVKG